VVCSASLGACSKLAHVTGNAQSLLWSQFKAAPFAQVATAATMSAAGLEAMRMALSLLEQRKQLPLIDQALLIVGAKLVLTTLPGLIAGRSQLG
jgi:hypothetical protein